MSEDDGEWFTDPEHHLQAYRVRTILKAGVKLKSHHAFEISFNAQHINSGSLMPTFYLQHNYLQI